MQTADLAAAVQAIARSRDKAAFAMIFNHFAPRVKAYLVRLGTTAGEAEELVQDVLLTVWRRAETYDAAQAGVGTWVFTIARNRRIDMLRRDKRPNLDPNDPMLQPEPPPAPDQTVSAVEWEDRLVAAVDELPADQSQLVRLAYYEDCSHSDIAQRLNLPLGTVKSRLRLAMARLRSRFEEQ